jgi:hypothetical protein
MILAKIRQHPVCPDGMDVSVRPDPDRGWTADGIPLPDSHIGYADCADYVGQVVRGVDYDLSS